MEISRLSADDIVSFNRSLSLRQTRQRDHEWLAQPCLVLAVEATMLNLINAQLEISRILDTFTDVMSLLVTSAHMRIAS
jgi:hypothetical protein